MKILKLIICICLLFDKGNCQDVINPYANYSGSPMPQYDIMSSGYNFNTIINSNSSSYNGEYMIQFDLLWWVNNYPAGGGNFNVQRLQQEKIEELYLYIIEQNFRIEKLESQIELMKKE